MPRNNKNSDTAVLEPSVSTDEHVQAVASPSRTLEMIAKAVGGGLASFKVTEGKASQHRTLLRQTIRQHLAEVADMAKEAGEASGEVTAKAAAVAFELYEARRDDELSASEVSEILGEIFGVKGTGKNVGRVMKAGEKGAGKTPAGTGEEIRKRVVRANAAFEFATKGLSPSTKYFDGLDQGAVSDLVLDLAPNADDGTTLWSLYGTLGEMKRENSDPIPFHMNAERVAKFQASITENIKSLATAINHSGELKASYAGLFNAVIILNELIDQ